MTKPEVSPHPTASRKANHLFLDYRCSFCALFLDCEIIVRAFCSNIDDPGYPKQLQIIAGEPFCTEFELMERS